MQRESIPFKELEFLGEGSQGRVYKGVLQDPHSDFAQTVAIKILHSETAVDIWRQEFESLRRVRSPYCVQVLSFERVEKRPALVLEYVEGVSLTDIGQTCILSAENLQEISAQLENALKDLHGQGVFHGDLSPQNVLLDTQGRVRVLDFGFANCSLARPRVTPQFASPERLAGGVVDHTTDIFALGKVMEFLRGHALPDCVYLSKHPTDRRFQDLSPCSVRQMDLGKKVRELRARRERELDLKTRTQIVSVRKSPPRSRARAFGLVAIFLMTVSSAAQLRLPPKLGKLSVRTREWHFFSLNGRPLGYSPVSVPLQADQAYELSWISARGRGHKTLALSPDEARTLEDRDFSH